MQTIANLKLLFVLLAALAASSAVLFYREHQVIQMTRRAHITAQLERDREQIRNDDAEYRAQEALQKRVGAGKKNAHAWAEHALKRPISTTH
jgi:hypothetical protein